MQPSNHTLLVLLRNEFMSESAIKKVVENLNELLKEYGSTEKFCHAHELMTRNRITSRPRKILNAISQVELKAFHFLINKN